MGSDQNQWIGQTPTRPANNLEDKSGRQKQAQRKFDLTVWPRCGRSLLQIGWENRSVSERNSC